MGRVKLKIRQLENSSGRQSTYSKRKNGLIKKANELSILCDVDIALLMFSPSGKPSLYKGQHSSIDKIIERYSRHTPQERAKRKLESLEALKKTFRKSDHDVKIRDFLGPSYVSVEDLRSQAESLKTQLSEVQKKLSNWTTLDKIESIEHLGQMEISLRTSLNQLQTRKANLRKQQMEMRVNEFQDNIHPPFTFGIEEQLQPLPWVPNNNHSQHMVLSNSSNLIPLRDSDCSAGTSLESYSGLLNAGELVQQDNFLTDSSRYGDSSLQLNDQFNLQVLEQQFHPSYNFGLVNDGYFQPIEQMNTQENILDFLLDRKYEVPQSGYDPLHHSWVSASSETCGSGFEEHLFPQVHCSFDEHEMKELDHMFLKAAPHSSLIN